MSNDIKGVKAGYVTVETWKAGELKNNCPWNIATIQVKQKHGNNENFNEEDYLQEIAELTDDIMELNNLNEGDYVYTGDEILIPLEYASEEISANIESTTANVREAQESLSLATVNVAAALSALNDAMAKDGYNFNGTPNKEVQDERNSAKLAYQEALKNERECKDKLQKENNKLKELNESYIANNNDIREAIHKIELEQNKLNEQKEENKEKIAALAEQKKSLEEALESMKQMRAEAQAEEQAADETLSKANQNEYAAKKLGFIGADNNMISNEQLENLRLDSSSVSDAAILTIGLYFERDNNDDVTQKFHFNAIKNNNDNNVFVFEETDPKDDEFKFYPSGELNLDDIVNIIDTTGGPNGSVGRYEDNNKRVAIEKTNGWITDIDTLYKSDDEAIKVLEKIPELEDEEITNIFSAYGSKRISELLNKIENEETKNAIKEKFQQMGIIL